MTQEVFDNIVEMFKKRYNLMQDIKQLRASYKQVLQKSLEELTEDSRNDDIKNIEYYDFSYSIDRMKKCSDLYVIRYELEQNIMSYFGDNKKEMFIDFESYIKNLMTEEYLECKNIKEEIFISY